MRYGLACAGVIGVMMLLIWSWNTGGGAWGEFEGRVVASWSDDGRNMVIEEPFAYVDPRGKRWEAPTGTTVDGASIPRPLWTIIGGPFEGQYRNASVVHDVYCDSMSEPSNDVHMMFYEACRCGGVNERTAKMLYFAVLNFGPHWEPVIETSQGNDVVVKQVPVDVKVLTDDDLRAMTAYFESNNPSLDEIETLSLSSVP